MSVPRQLVLTAPLLAILSIGLFAACGGGHDGDPDGNDSGSTIDSVDSGGGADETYVAALCKASLEFSNAFEKLLSDPANASKSQEEAFDLIIEPWEKFLADVKKAEPPADARDYHNGIVRALSDGLEGLKKKDPAAFDSIAASNVPDPPEDVKARLEKLAADNKDCQKADFMFN